MIGSLKTDTIAPRARTPVNAHRSVSFSQESFRFVASVLCAFRACSRPLCMANTRSTRRTFLLTGIAAAATVQPVVAEGSQMRQASAVTTFLRDWDAAWAKHDAASIAALHTEDSVTVNRFGTVVRGRSDLEKALGFLHGAGGPFHNSVFPPLELMIQRTVAPGVQAVQAKWQNPVMKPDGKIDPASINDMIVTFVLLHGASGWKASEVNLVNVEKMDLPFSNPNQKPR